ncbi:DNA-binding transcriptional LysR family regulator [Pseudomonas sp. URMO17WK12:I1]|uniref:LysR family transcriptional regulator n=1 Tax=unclassified Pseudomonas TaxID=196821 RepID=UPI00047F27F3|nr:MULTISPECIES: LysR family transcriptional regulator [unclassified Pseudomonas]PZW68890.1 DNA-binding transcriptional LysR family regulator [Pseudomonas sp. URMO17WK12:I1]
MNVEDLRLFVTTLDAGSFTAAADTLGVTKQYVSRRVAALEALLGVRLLNRTTRRLQATELGLLLYDKATTILADLRDAQELVSAQGASLRGTLRVSAPMTFATLHLSHVLPLFMQQHPHINLEIDLNDRAVDLLADGYDMSIRIGTLEDSSLIAKRLTDMQTILCASPAYLAEHGTPADLGELQQHACLLYGHSRHVEWRLREAGKPRNLTMRGQLRANNGELIRDAAIAGMGIAYLPTFIVGQALASGALVPILEQHWPASAAVYAVYPQHRQSARAVQVFSDFIKQQIEHLNA